MPPHLFRYLVLFALSIATSLSMAVDPLAPAKALLESYVQLGAEFDPKVADLYSDNAVIRNKRSYPNGTVRELSIPAPKYKSLIREAMPTAKSKGDRSSYSQVRYLLEDKGVRINAARYSELKKYTSSISILVSQDSSGVWKFLKSLANPNHKQAS